jgi:hypothetical protein
MDSIVMTAIGALVGAVLSILLSLFIEFARAPKLIMVPMDPDVRPYVDANRTATWLRVKLQNLPFPRFQWLNRVAAMQCQGDIQFHDRTTGAPIFKRRMPIRWSGSDEPSTPVPTANGTIEWRFDAVKYNAALTRNCYTGPGELIDVVGRYDHDSECYGWSNETYFPDKGWRNPDWRIPSGTYLVKVTVSWAAGKKTSAFVLDNSQARDKFCLLPATTQDLSTLGIAK